MCLLAFFFFFFFWGKDFLVNGDFRVFWAGLVAFWDDDQTNLKRPFLAF